jgi:hypothetical protein
MAAERPNPSDWFATCGQNAEGGFVRKANKSSPSVQTSSLMTPGVIKEHVWTRELDYYLIDPLGQSSIRRVLSAARRISAAPGRTCGGIAATQTFATEGGACLCAMAPPYAAGICFLYLFDPRGQISTGNRSVEPWVPHAKNSGTCINLS